MRCSDQKVWSSHYDRSKSKLLYPDEYLASFLVRFFRNRDSEELSNHGSRLMVLDLGCGSGRHLELLSRYPCSFVGQDFALNILKEQNHPAICGRTDALPFCENSFDLIIMWGVFHYLHEEETAKTISEIFRVMKPNAHFIGTLRSKKDTHLRGVLEEGDLKSGKAIFYSRRKSIKIFSQFF